MKPDDAYELYFMKALETISDGKPFILYFESEAEALRQKANIMDYLRRSKVTGNALHTWSTIYFSVKPVPNHVVEVTKPDKLDMVKPTYALVAELNSACFQQALAHALGVDNLDEF